MTRRSAVGDQKMNHDFSGDDLERSIGNGKKDGGRKGIYFLTEALAIFGTCSRRELWHNP